GKDNDLIMILEQEKERGLNLSQHIRTLLKHYFFGSDKKFKLRLPTSLLFLLPCKGKKSGNRKRDGKSRSRKEKRRKEKIMGRNKKSRILQVLKILAIQLTRRKY
ncbi:MAG: hypothetical protein RMJ17_00355, partial [Candidatus Aenigmarchaeota archaeon]|nr:hypothetical protein [Candidatus Aenigmarchaeota archaeon]MDW7999106.1 hypothetical protein [Thermodesulfovibrio sp.]MDW8149041.1 hypothetical protein [Candidatus Aenigmarchaeota archaeon]